MKRAFAAACLFLVACACKPEAAEPTTPAPPDKPVVDTPPKPPEKPPEPTKPEQPPAPELIAADTPKTTVAGNHFIAPAGWTLTVRAPATILTAPEGDSRIALIDVQAADADKAVALAWAAYAPDAHRDLKVATPGPDHDGWSGIKGYEYRTSPNEKRDVGATAMMANGTWTVVIYDMTSAVGEKRGSQVGVVFGQLLPKGYERESFAGKQAHPLDQARLAELSRFVETGQKLLGVPGVAVGLIQDGKVVFAGGFGVRQLGKPAKVDGDTKFLVASNTKALTTLMLGKLVQEKKLTWDTPAQSLLPQFKLGDADTTSKVLVRHLICACTGMPRQDMEWILEFRGRTPETVLATLGTMQPTSKFGELFQYSNPLAAAAGYLGGHVAFPKLELGRAYDQAMQTRVFGPLGMKDTTLDYAKAHRGNFASAHSPDIDGKPTLATEAVNLAIVPVRPAGAAWSTVRDMLKYVQMEIDEGTLPGGKPYLDKDILLARRAPQVAMGEDATYGMGLMVETRYGITVVHHGGDMVGYHSDMIWIPEQKVGAVILTNGDPGWVIRGIFRRKLLEVLFDGRAEADASLAAAAQSWTEQIAAERKLLTVPADADAAGKLAAAYHSDALGDIKVIHKGTSVILDVGEWKTEAATRSNPDGTTSLVTIAPGISGIELVIGDKDGAKTLTLRDAQHEYVFVGK
ncbi:MAG TPA: serine hydrolase domain-containing protein [Kofleriaceae bacterium]|jgi:CubicO group peptidase (beta-lactamase class C family)|nr:serine hydrolase domain-containing protein [Kofleriaceae bacterium]